MVACTENIAASTAVPKKNICLLLFLWILLCVYLCNGDINIQDNISTFEGILPLCVFNEIGCISYR